MSQVNSFQRRARLAGQERASLAGLAVLLTLASCSDSGADVDTFGGGAPPIDPLAVDFFLRRDLLLGGNQVADALAVDLNGDGRADLIETNVLDRSIRVALRDALGGFATDFVLPTTGAAWRLGAGDFNGDGLIDVAVVEVEDPFGGTPGMTVFFQDAPGSFSGSSHIAFPLAPLDIDVIPASGSSLAGGSLGDVLVVAEHESRRISAIVWNGTELEVVETLDSTSLEIGEPLTVAAIDVLGDGLFDLVVGEVDVDGGALPDRVILYPADVAGGFGAPELLALSSVPVIDNAGDIDGNGFDDVSIAELGGNTAQVLFFDGAGDVLSANIAFPGDPSSVVFGDFDGVDGLDAAATLLGSQELMVRLSDGLGGFEPPVRYNVGFLPRAVAAVELTDDGIVDLLCASNGDLNILPGNGQGGFQGARGYAVGNKPVLVACDDLDGDGDSDVISLDIEQRQVTFLENVDGAGTLVIVSEVPFLQPAEIELPGGLDIGDVDGDGQPDVVLALHELGQVQVLRNPGSAAFGAADPQDIYDLGAGLYGVEIADVNSDGAVDVIVSSADDDTARLLLNDPTDLGMFLEQPPINLPFSPAAVLCVDINDDGFEDLAFTGTQPDGGGATGVVGVLGGDGLGNFAVEAVLPAATVSASLACGDLDEDGNCDLVTGQPALAFDEVWIYFSSGNFGFTPTPLEIGQSPGAVEVADVDRDGDLDLLVPAGEGQLRIAIGDGTGAFDTIEPPDDVTWPVPDGTTFVCFEDMDGDELPDLVLVSPDTPNVWVGLNASIPIPQD
ncbi:MAG: VCBS repeat-containing protein [Planctomycetota bacterium]